MKKYISLIIIVAILFSCQKKQTNTERKSWQLLENYRKTSFAFTDKAKKNVLDSIAIQLDIEVNDVDNINSRFLLADYYWEINHKYDYYLLLKKNQENAHKIPNQKQEARALSGIGEYYEQRMVLDSAYDSYKQSEKICRKIKDTLNIGRTLLYKSSVLFSLGIFSECEATAVEALKLIDKADNLRLKYEANIQIGLALKEMNNYNTAIAYFTTAMNNVEDLERSGEYPRIILDQSRAACYNNIGTTYENMGLFDIAITYYEKGLAIPDIKKSKPQYYIMLKNNIAYSKMKIGITDGVEKQFLESINESKKLSTELQTISCKRRIGEYYLEIKDTLKGLQYLNDGLQQAKKNKSSYDVLKIYKLLSIHDLKNKKQNTLQYTNLADSLQTKERETKNKFARIEYETEKVEDKNEKLIISIAIFVIIGSFLVILLLGTRYVYRLKYKNQKLKLENDINEANQLSYQLMITHQKGNEDVRHEERERIAQELHDGVVNSIFTTRYNLESLNINDEAQKSILVAALSKTELEIRRISHDLNKEVFFEDRSLTELIEKLIATQKNDFNTDFKFNYDKNIEWHQYSSEFKIHIYRIIQESIQNVNKYAKAKNCTISILKSNNKIKLKIDDDGIGFNYDKKKDGIGFKNIVKRIETINGSMTINTKIGFGSNIEILL